jgi:hypothetical protein
MTSDANYGGGKDVADAVKQAEAMTVK